MRDKAYQKELIALARLKKKLGKHKLSVKDLDKQLNKQKEGIGKTFKWKDSKNPKISGS